MEEYKDFRIVSDGKFSMFKILQSGSGAVPNTLSGYYTTKKQAMFAIDGYKPKRGAKKHGETTTTA